MPARVRSERTSLSNCANAASTPSISLPVEVSSIGSVADRSEMPRGFQFLSFSMIFTSGPREILAMNPRFECWRHSRDILPRAERISAAASSPVNDEDVMLKNRSLAVRTACFSSWL